MAAGRYRAPDGRDVSVAADVDAARAGTRMFGPEPVSVRQSGDAGTFGDAGAGAELADTVFEVTGESSLQAARRLAGAPGAVLNFASARNPGGGYLRRRAGPGGGLCRGCAPYTCLLTAGSFYDHHRAHHHPFHTDRVIHSPAVPVFRDDRGRCWPSRT